MRGKCSVSGMLATAVAKNDELCICSVVLLGEG